MGELKPLYLDGRTAPLRVELVEDALLVRCERAADALCPIRRLDRVLCWGEVWWRSDALGACGEAGVTVAFHHGGEICATVAPRAPRARSFAAILEAACGRAAFLDGLTDWAAHQRSVALRLALRREPRLARWSRHSGARPVERRLAPLYESWLRRRLAEAGAPAAYLGPSSARPNLLKLFREARAAELAPLIFRLTVEEASGRPREEVRLGQERRWALQFEAEAPRLRRNFDRAWRDFERLARDAAEGADIWEC